MPLQSNVNVEVRYGAETVLGTQSVAAGQNLRRVSSTLALAKDAFTSNEVRPDQQVFDARHGVRRVAGNIQGELSTRTYDDFIEASLRGTWTAGVAITQATATMSTQPQLPHHGHDGDHPYGVPRSSHRHRSCYMGHHRAGPQAPHGRLAALIHHRAVLP